MGSGTLRTPLYPQGFLPLEQSRSTDTGLVAGLRGVLDAWRWDVSLNHGRNHFSLDVGDTVNLSLGATSPTRFFAGTLDNRQTLLNLDVSRDVDVGLAQPLFVALGAESRHERYAIGAGEPGSYSGSGAQGFSGFRPANAGTSSRHREALYLDTEASFSKGLSASAALRAERYSDFGSATSAKLSGRWALTPAVALRGTASTGFRAPSLAQQHYTITTTNFIVVNGVNTPLETGTFAVGSAAAQALAFRT